MRWIFGINFRENLLEKKSKRVFNNSIALGTHDISLTVINFSYSVSVCGVTSFMLKRTWKYKR